jgi:uncharacterized protein (TIGR02145 family)
MYRQLIPQHTLKTVRTIAIIAVVGILALLGYGQAQNSADSVAAMFTDPRDGKTYRTVKIGKLTWMAENLNFETAKSWCYGNADSNCTKYGRLYTWNAAMKACPAGWKLPDTAAWNNLIRAAGDSVAGTRLRSKTGWANYYGSGHFLSDHGRRSIPGTDEFGFSALPGGRRDNSSYYDAFEYDFTSGRWWSATEFGIRCTNCAYYQFMSYCKAYVWNLSGNKGFAYSVRCVRN